MMLRTAASFTMALNAAGDPRVESSAAGPGLCGLPRTPYRGRSDNSPSRHLGEYALSGQRVLDHLPGGIALQALGCGVRPAAQRPDATLEDRKQVSTVHPDRWAARELEPLCLLVALDGHQLHVRFRP